MRKIIYTLFIFTVVLLFTACDDYGDKIEMNGGEVYYKEPATNSEATALAKYLVASDYFDGSPATVQLLKANDSYTVNFVVKKGMAEDSSVVKGYRAMSPLLSYQVFNGAIVNIGLCNTELELVHLLAGYNFGKLITFGDDDLYYTEGIDKKLAQRFGDYLRETSFFSGKGLNAQLNKKGDIYQFKYNVQDGYEKDEQYKATARAYAVLLSRDLFDDAEVEIHLCDDYFNTLAVVTSGRPKKKK